MAYVSDETGRTEVYVQPVPGPGGRMQVSAGGGSEPIWYGNARLYYRGPRHVMRATLAASPLLRLVRRDTLFADTYDRENDAPAFDVLPGGKELLMFRSASAAPPRLAFVLNWTDLVRRTAARR
jgi:hypothetical protein